MRRNPALSALPAQPSLEESLDALPFRQAPHNIEAEQALLGAILINNESFDRVSGFLQAPHFFEPLHGKLFEIMGKLIGMGKHASPITLKTFFEFGAADWRADGAAISRAGWRPRPRPSSMRLPMAG